MKCICSYKINREIGRYLSEHVKDRGILKSAFEKNVPVFVPAFSDSEIGLDVALHNRARARKPAGCRCTSIRSRIWSTTPTRC